MKKDFLGLENVSKEEIQELLDRAKFMKAQIKQGNKALDILKGKSIVTLFYENSTRTRCSFEDACMYLGASVCNVEVGTSSVQKGECLVDTAVTLDKMMTDAIIIRHSMAGAPAIIAQHTNASVINAGDGMHEHPTQALLDMFSMEERFGTLKGLTVSIIGDIKHSRVAKSNIIGLSKMGAKVKVYGPNTLMPWSFDGFDCTVCKSIDDAFIGSDVVMGLRIQLERQMRGLFPSNSEYTRFYGITSDRMAKANKGAVVMHPGPVNRGVEISYDVLDSDICIKDEQVTNGVATRVALLESVCI